MNPLAVLLAALATYRISRMIAEEDGPFDVFAFFRSKILKPQWFAVGLRCIYCVSFWIGLVLASVLFRLAYIRFEDIVLVWPGLSGAAIVIDKYWKR